MFKSWVKFGAGLVSVLLLTGCGPTKVDSKTEPPLPSLDAYYTQDITWVSCGDKDQCASIWVPMNYANLDDGSIMLALSRHKSTSSKPLGSILVNPGGPGASGAEFVLNSPDRIATKRLLKNYDLIGFDPRGVQNSAAVSCYPKTSDMDEFLYGDSGFEFGSEQDIEASRQAMKDFAAACEKNTGKLLKYVDTQSAARDMDIIRGVLGGEKLNYLGFSYGTFLGNTYAQLFPKKVGHMVLDGAIDPTASGADQSLHQLKAFDASLKAYLADCLSQTSCPFTGTVDEGLKRISELLFRLETSTLKNSDDSKRQVNQSIVETGIILAMYSEGWWPRLTEAFTQVFDENDGAIFASMADAYNDRSDGKYVSNLNEANIAINCLDGRSDSSEAAMKKQNQRLLEASPTLGRYWQWGALMCADWPYPNVKALPSYSAKGSPTILVIGTTGDPATPYSEAVSLAHKILSNGFLLTYEGEGHTAYGRSNSCVANVVDDYFIDSKLPAQEPTC